MSGLPHIQITTGKKSGLPPEKPVGTPEASTETSLYRIVQVSGRSPPGESSYQKGSLTSTKFSGSSLGALAGISGRIPMFWCQLMHGTCTGCSVEHDASR